MENQMIVLDDLKQYVVQAGNHSAMPGHQVVVRFPNGFGASVIRGLYSYGGREGLFELGVLTFNDNGTWKLHYDNPVADGDVVGGLTAQEVRQLLRQIMEFDPIP